MKLFHYLILDQILFNNLNFISEVHLKFVKLKNQIDMIVIKICLIKKL